MGAIHAAAGMSGGFIFTDQFGSDFANYDLRSRAVAAGWNQIDPLLAGFSNFGAVVYATSTSFYAFDTGLTAYPPGSQLVFYNSGYICGMGGQGNYGSAWDWAGAYGGSINSPVSGVAGYPGGGAMRLTLPTYFNNVGVVASGGGGGGGGQGRRMDLQIDSEGTSTYIVGSSGSGGGGRGGRYNSGSSSSYYTSAGGAGTFSGPGAPSGGTSQSYSNWTVTGGAGGHGGDWGQNGYSGNSASNNIGSGVWSYGVANAGGPYAGGATGHSINGWGNCIVQSTGTIYGALV
jgi:hypothetical protein